MIVPVLMEKLREVIRLGRIREAGRLHLEWNLEETLKALSKEVEIRECDVPLLKTSHAPGIRNGNGRTINNRPGIGTASALLTEGMEKKCVYCRPAHPHEDCPEVTTPEERKSILKKYAKCFICLIGGHRSFQCRSNRRCMMCKGKHHASICNISQPKQEPKDAALTPSATPLNANAVSWVGSTGSGKSVALQTALANVNGKEESRVRCLFDTGSHKSFITAEAVDPLCLRPVRGESLCIKAFGQTEADRKETDVVEFSLTSLRGGKVVNISCFVVDLITSIVNVHPEEVKKQCKYLNNVSFSDVSRHNEMLSIQILIGSDFIWQFQESESLRGGPNEPVAVKTTLVWVLSGPLRGKHLDVIDEINVKPIISDVSPGGLDPADLGSRGVTASHLSESKMRWTGSSWLTKGEVDWPKGLQLENSTDIGVERRKIAVLSTVTVADRKICNVIDIKKFSKLQKLLRVTTWVMRFIRHLKAKRLRNERDMDSLSVKEINGAE